MLKSWYLSKYLLASLMLYALTWEVRAQEVAGFQVIGSNLSPAKCSVVISILDAHFSTTTSTRSVGEPTIMNFKAPHSAKTKTPQKHFKLKQNSFTVSLKLLERLVLGNNALREHTGSTEQEQNGMKETQTLQKVAQLSQRFGAGGLSCEISARVSLSCGKDSGVGVLPAQGVNIRLVSRDKDEAPVPIPIPIHTFRIIKLDMMDDHDLREKLSHFAAMLDQDVLKGLASSSKVIRPKLRPPTSPLWVQVLEWKRQRSPWGKRRTRLIVQLVLLPSNHNPYALSQTYASASQEKMLSMEFLVEKTILFKRWLKLRSRGAYRNSVLLDNEGKFYHDKNRFQVTSCMKTEAEADTNYHQQNNRKQKRQTLAFAAILFAVVQLSAGRRIVQLP